MVLTAKLKRSFLVSAVASLCIALAIACMNGLFVAKAETSTFTDYPSTPVTVTNSQFSDTGSGSPASPTGWTSEGNAGTSVSGIIDLGSIDSLNKDDAYKLYQYGYSGTLKPKTPFGTSKFPNTNKKLLMINTRTDNTPSVYGYTSSNFTLEANRFYEISVYVKTSNFADGTGATVRLNGVDTGKEDDKFSANPQNELAFHAINTFKPSGSSALGEELTEDNLYGFVKYTFYVATSYKSSTASLTLSVGSQRYDEDANINYNNPAAGYAFFDNVSVTELSPMVFHSYADTFADNDLFSHNVLVRDLNKAKSYLYNTDSNTISANDFERIDDTETCIGQANTFTYNAQTYEEVEEFNFSADPVSPNGKSYNAEIFCISTWNSAKKTYTTATAGFRTKKTYTVKRNGYARISVWAKTQDIEGDVSIRLTAAGEVLNNTEDGKLTANSVTVSTSEGPAARYGWTEYALYVKGSAIKDYDVHVELWIGSSTTSQTKGIAMFSEIRAEEITATDYSEHSGSGTAVTFDPTFTDTGISNGLFFNAASSAETDYPLAPADWTYLTPDTVTTTGFATDKVSGTEDVVSGIVVAQKEHFEDNADKYGVAFLPNDAEGNLLLINSDKKVAAGYASNALTISANTNYTISVRLLTYNLNGYGANLVLKNSDNNVISTIEKINTYEQFIEYTFYVKGGPSDKTVTLEIWLGLNDRKDNRQKLASGTVYVASASMASVSSSEEAQTAAFNENYDRCITAIKNGNATTLPYAAYSFTGEAFDAFDLYDDNTVKTPYNWTLATGDSSVRYGIFSATNRDPSELIPEYFERGEEEGLGAGILFLRNNAPTYSRLVWNNAFNLTENKYYQITVRLKVDFDRFNNASTAIGAGVELTGTEYRFENIRSTTVTEGDMQYPERYRVFTFYVKANEATEIGLAFTLGSNEFTNRNASGIVYVTNIDCLEIDSTVYDEKSGIIAQYEKDKGVADPYNMYGEISVASNEPVEEPSESGNSGIQWWTIPSILFAVALVIAIIGFVIRRMMDKRANRKTTEKTVSYDRRSTLNKQQKTEEKTVAKDGTVIRTVTREDSFSDFDDDAPIVENKPAPAPVRTTEESTVTDNASAEGSDVQEVTESEITEVTAEAAVTEDAPVQTEPVQAPAEASDKKKNEPTNDTPAKADSYVDTFDD